MAGHSHAANIKHRKNAQDSKRAKVWTKLLRAVSVAAKIAKTEDIQMNSQLRSVFFAARQAGVSLDRIEAAIHKAVHGSSEIDSMSEVRYNAMFHGISIVIEGLTDNKNRTIGDLRTVINKYDGSVVDTGSVEFMFRHIGLISLDKKAGDFEKVFDFCVENGALDVEGGEEEYYIETETTDLHNLSGAITDKFGQINSANLIWKPITEATVLDQEILQKFEKVIDGIEDLDDIQNIYHNLSRE